MSEDPTTSPRRALRPHSPMQPPQFELKVQAQPSEYDELLAYTREMFAELEKQPFSELSEADMESMAIDADICDMMLHTEVSYLDPKVIAEFAEERKWQIKIACGSDAVKLHQ